MIKIWGTSFSLIGDLIMSLPQLVYFKKKYKNIYVNFVIHKKISLLKISKSCLKITVLFTK